MRRIAFILLFVPSLGFGVTINDIPAIQETSEKIVDQANQIKNFATFVKSLANENWSFNVPFSTTTLTLSVQQRQDLVNRYNTMKSNLNTLVDSLPQ